MFFTYIIRSISNPTKTYIGFTSNIDDRLKSHNMGKSSYTKHYIPWKLEFYAAFHNKLTAINFEKYLKSGSGKAFASKHFDII
ncbi:MAG: excinuclease ABC subunit C [Candidatus Cloacimonas sp. 4484_143]|nr:MAG: excinuclease ABC subunit C [Candidatus Cloacimonas sp. 4484_143]